MNNTIVNTLLEKYKTVNPETIFLFSEINEVYPDYAETVLKNKVEFGFPEFDDKMKGIRPGEVIYLISGTNIGKTSYAINVINHLAGKDFCVPFFSLENNEYQVFERIIQIRTDYTSFDIERKFANREEEIIRIGKEISREFSNIINIIHRISLSEIPSYIRVCEELSNLKAGIIIIDYAQLVMTTGTSEYARMSEVAQQIKEISLKMRLPILVLSQVSRAEAKNEDGLSIYSAKGSGEIENSAQILLSLERPKNIPLDAGIEEYVMDKFRKGEVDILKLNVLKKKRGSYGHSYLMLNKRSLKLTEIKTNK
jgi:replicative DNA helicase